MKRKGYDSYVEVPKLLAQLREATGKLPLSPRLLGN